MNWPETVGKSVQEYTGEAASFLERASFENELLSFLRSQGATGLDSVTVARLFKIVSAFHRDRVAVQAMKKDGIVQDWSARKRLIRVLTTMLENMKHRAQADIALKDRPLTSLLAKSVLRKTSALLCELEQVVRFQQLQEAIFQILSDSTKSTKDTVWEMNCDLVERFPQSKQQELDLIIGGALIAAKLRDPNREPVANVPMARLRAKLRAEKNYVPEFDDTDFIGGPTEAPVKPKAKNKIRVKRGKTQ